MGASRVARGRPTIVNATLEGSLPLLRGHAFASASDGLFVAADTTYDDLGNPTRVQGANGRCSDLAYDTEYGQLPTSETVYRSSGCTNGLVVSGQAYDRGLGLVTVAVDMNDQPTIVSYDGFGRTQSLTKPSPSGGAGTVASVRIEYFLPPSLGSNLSAIHTFTEDGANADGSEYLESWAFFDGFGRTRTTLSEADPAAGDGGNWVVSGLVTHDANGVGAVLG